MDVVDQAEVDHVDAELGVDDVLHRLGDLVRGQRRHPTSRGVDVGDVAVVGRVGRHLVS